MNVVLLLIVAIRGRIGTLVAVGRFSWSPR
jgi:hypothetical protein